MENLIKSLEFLRKYTEDIMAKNIEFLVKNYKEVLDSCFGLVNDIIDIESWLSPRKDLPEEKRKEIYSKYLMYPMLIHVVYPNLNFLPITVLLGALPQAFYTIRAMLEAFAMALYADNKEELKDMQWFEKIEHKSVRNATVSGIRDSLRKILAKILGEEEGNKWLSYLLELYQAISAWVHPVARVKASEKGEFAAGLLKAVVLTMADHGIPPGYGLLIPMEYGVEDLDDLKHLNSIIEYSRPAVATVAYVWSVDKDIADREALRRHFEKLAGKLNQSP